MVKLQEQNTKLNEKETDKEDYGEDASLRDMASVLASREAELEEKATRWKEYGETLKNYHEDLTKQQEEFNKEKEEFERQKNEFGEKDPTAVTQESGTSEEIESLKEEINKKDATLEKLQEAVMKLQEQNSQMKRTVETGGKEEKADNTDLDEREKELALREAQIEESAEKWRQYGESLKQYQQDLAKEQEEFNKVQQELETSKQELENSVRTENEDDQQEELVRSSLLEEELRKVRHNSENLEAMIVKLQEENVSLNAKLEVAPVTTERTKDLSDMEKLLESKEGELKTWEEQLKIDAEKWKQFRRIPETVPAGPHGRAGGDRCSQKEH